MSRPAEPGRPPSRLHIALVLDLAPRKLGSLERWILGAAREARARGHRVDVFSRGPVHAAVKDGLTSAEADWYPVEELEHNPLSAIRRLRRYDVVEYHLFGPRTRVALLGLAAWPARILLVERNSDWGRGRTLRQRIKLKVLNLVTTPRIAALIGVSNYVRDRSAMDLGLPPGRTVTIYNGVDLELFSPNPRQVAPEPPLTVLTVAHLIPEKGIEYLLRAFANVPPTQARLVLVGEGPDEHRLRQLADELGAGERVSFCGLRDDVATLLRQTTIFVHPATWGEAFGWTIAEAMASGCAVIATNVGGIPELIEHDQSGLLVPPADTAALTHALIRLVDDRALRLELGRNARRRAEELFGLVQSARAHVYWFEQVARRKHAGQPKSGH
jgi:glycosyltransferase involved in cell wall biosynthesis